MPYMRNNEYYFVKMIKNLLDKTMKTKGIIVASVALTIGIGAN